MWRYIFLRSSVLLKFQLHLQLSFKAILFPISWNSTKMKCIDVHTYFLSFDDKTKLLLIDIIVHVSSNITKLLSRWRNYLQKIDDYIEK